MSEPCDLSLKAQSGFAFFLRELELASFIVSDIGHPYVTAETPKDLVLSRIYNGGKALDLLAKFIECVSRLPRCG